MSWQHCNCISKLVWSIPELEAPDCPVHGSSNKKKKMAQDQVGVVDETSPLLDHRDANLKGKGKAADYYVSISEVSPHGSLNGEVNGNGAVKKSLRDDEEESLGQGELVEPTRSINVTRIILVLLIGSLTCLFSVES